MEFELIRYVSFWVISCLTDQPRAGLFFDLRQHVLIIDVHDRASLEDIEQWYD